jgi:hypothetical protein
MPECFVWIESKKPTGRRFRRVGFAEIDPGLSYAMIPNAPEEVIPQQLQAIIRHIGQYNIMIADYSFLGIQMSTSSPYVWTMRLMKHTYQVTISSRQTFSYPAW